MSPAKLTRAEKKAARTAKREKRRETWRNLRQAFTITRENDPRFIPYLVIFGVLAAAVAFVLVFFIAGNAIIPIPIAILAAVVAVMLVFSRRAQRSMFAQAEGTPG